MSADTEPVQYEVVHTTEYDYSQSVAPAHDRVNDDYGQSMAPLHERVNDYEITDITHL